MFIVRMIWMKYGKAMRCDMSDGSYAKNRFKVK